jgi:hypothetical protein
VIDVLNSKIELVLVVVRFAAELSAVVGEHAIDGNLVFVENGTAQSFIRSAAVRGVLRS